MGKCCKTFGTQGVILNTSRICYALHLGYVSQEEEKEQPRKCNKLKLTWHKRRNKLLRVAEVCKKCNQYLVVGVTDTQKISCCNLFFFLSNTIFSSSLLLHYHSLKPQTQIIEILVSEPYSQLWWTQPKPNALNPWNWNSQNSTQLNSEIEKIRIELSQNNQKHETLTSQINFMNQTYKICAGN